MDLFNDKKIWDLETKVLKLEEKIKELEEKLQSLDKATDTDSGLSKL